tara:strand:- start:13662 stop:15656 length:1995 start_codon:yes stop_codon:yes gene_type:complete
MEGYSKNVSTPTEASNTASIQRKITSGQFDQALAELQKLLDQDPNHADAHYMAAVCCRYQKDYQQAQLHLDLLNELALDRGRLYQEQGHLYRAQSLTDHAIVAYQAACQVNSALTASWQAQVELLKAVGDASAAKQALRHLKIMQAMPKPLLAATDLMDQGKLFKAEKLCKQYLQKAPTDAEAMRLLADIAFRMGAAEEAEFLLSSAVEFHPDNNRLAIDYITFLRQRQKFSESVDAAEQLLKTDKNNPQFQSVYAIAKMQLGDYAEAVNGFDRVLAQLPHDAITHTSKGHALKTWGKNAAAIESYQSAIESNPSYCEAYYSLANLKTYRFEDVELERMLALDNKQVLTPANATHLYFALGKAYEDRQQWDLAFAYYERGNRVKKQQSQYDADKMREELLSQRAFFSSDAIERLRPSGYLDDAPIFIVGLPRAGSTLLEQVISSHSQVDGTLELPNMLAIAQKLRRKGQSNNGQSYPELIADLSDAERNALGEQYIEETRIHRQNAPFFIDKMPNNFRHIGLIKTILPNAKIIDARRHPVACCFSGFKQLFAEGQEFSYSLDDIAQYYNDYLKLMAHWDSIMPGAILRVQYEDMTADTETQVRRILDYCGLPFESSCLEFYKTDRAVRTASSEQVRQPIYQSGVDQWRNFEAHLQPLISQLTDA